MQPFAADLVGTPPIESPAFWARPFRYPASSDPETATAQTVGIMCADVHRGAGDGLVQSTAGRAVQQFAGLGGFDHASQVAGSAFWWCRHFVKFVHHEFIIRRRLGEYGHLQGLISPEVLVRMDRPEGDCAIQAECVAAFLEVFGIPWELVTVAVNPRERDIFSHVYLYAVLPDGARLPLDASHGDFPGWEVESRRVFRRQVWDASGNRVADRASRFTGLHNYGMRRGMRGLGDVCNPSDADYDPAFCASQSAGATPPVLTTLPGVTPCTCVAGTCLEDGNSCSSLYTTPTGTPYTGATYTAPSQNSAQWASFATQLAKSGLTLAEINSIQPGTVVSANGAILRQSTGLPVPVGSSLTTSLTTMGTGNILLYGGLALAAIFAVSMLGSGRR